MRLIREEAIVLRCRPYLEADVIVSLFTKGEGRLTAMARGAQKSKKRFGNSLELGSHLNVVIEEHPRREMVVLRESAVQMPIPAWRRHWETIAVSSFALELALKTVPEKQEAAKKFSALRDFLSGLNPATAANDLLQFEHLWLKLTGWEPDMKQCGVCGKNFSGTKPLEILDHYWLHILGKPLMSAKLLAEAL